MMGSIIKLTRWSLQSEVHIYFFDTGCETFSVLNFFDTGSGTFFSTKFFRDRFRDFFRDQIFSRPVPRLFSRPNFFETGSDTIKKIEEFPGMGIPGTGMSHSELQIICCRWRLWILWIFVSKIFLAMTMAMSIYRTFYVLVSLEFHT